MQVSPEREQRNKAHKAMRKRGKKAKRRWQRQLRQQKDKRYCLHRGRPKMMQQGTPHTPLPQAFSRRQRDRLQIQPVACSFSSCSADSGVVWRGARLLIKWARRQTSKRLMDVSHGTTPHSSLLSCSLQGASKGIGIFAVLSGCAAKLLNGYESRHCQRGHPHIDWAEGKGGQRVHSAQRVNSANCIVPLCTEQADRQTDSRAGRMGCLGRCSN